MEKIILSGRSNQKLAKKIAAITNLKLAQVQIEDFFDGEINILINENIQDKNVILIQTICPPINNNIIELLLLIDAATRAQAASITLVIPYFAYSRKEKMSKPGEPISAKVIIDSLVRTKIKKIISIDLHSPAIQGFSEIPLINISTTDLFISEIKKLKINNLIVVSPDIGSTKRARNIAEKLNIQVAIIEKHRSIDSKDKIKILNIIGSVKDKNVLLIDDLISSGSTVVKAIDLLKNEGARKIYLAVSHIVINNIIDDKLLKSPIEKIFITDSIPNSVTSPKIKIVSLAKKIAQEIK